MLRVNQTSVTGPMPPGTGVTARAGGATAAVSTSPTRWTCPRPGDGVDADVEHHGALGHVLGADQAGRPGGDDQPSSAATRRSRRPGAIAA